MKHLEFVKKCVLTAVAMKESKEKKFSHKLGDSKPEVTVTINKTSAKEFTLDVKEVRERDVKKSVRDEVVAVDLERRVLHFTVDGPLGTLVKKGVANPVFLLCFNLSVNSLLFAEELYFYLNCPTVLLKLNKVSDLLPLITSHPELTLENMKKKVLITAGDKFFYKFARLTEENMTEKYRAAIKSELGDVVGADVSIKNIFLESSSDPKVLQIIMAKLDEIKLPYLTLEKPWAFTPNDYSLLTVDHYSEVSGLKKSEMSVVSRRSVRVEEIAEAVLEKEDVFFDVPSVTLSKTQFYLYKYNSDVPFVFKVDSTPNDGIRFFFYSHKNDQVFAVATIYEEDKLIVVTGLLNENEFKEGFEENQFHDFFEKDMTYSLFLDFVEKKLCESYECNRVVVLYDQSEHLSANTNFGSQHYNLPYQLCKCLNVETLSIPAHYSVSSENANEMRLKFNAFNMTANIPMEFQSLENFYEIDRKISPTETKFSAFVQEFFEKTNLSKETGLYEKNSEHTVEIAEFRKNVNCLKEGYNKMNFSVCFMHYDIPYKWLKYGDIYELTKESEEHETNIFLGVLLDSIDDFDKVKIVKRWEKGKYLKMESPVFVHFMHMSVDARLPHDVYDLTQNEEFKTLSLSH